MRLDFCVTTLEGLRADSRAPRGAALYAGLRAAGFGGVQAPSMAGVAEAGLIGTGLALVADPAQIDALARAHRAEGFACTTLICGSALDADATLDRHAGAILEASARHGYPLLLETHRGSITQDARRTLDLIARFPDLRFTGDFSHWNVGHEFALGDLAARLDAIAPLIERVDLVEGRIGSTNCTQIPLDGEHDARHFVAPHRAFWTRCFAAMHARGVEPVFAPQLLPAVIRAEGTDWPIDYACLRRDADGEWQEESDRWEQSLIHCAIARDCERAARQQGDPR